MRARPLRLLLLAGLCCLAACRDSDGSDAKAFTPFVSDLIRNRTDETGAPVEVNGRVFVFGEDAQAFDALLPSDDGSAVD